MRHPSILTKVSFLSRNYASEQIYELRFSSKEERR